MPGSADGGTNSRTHELSHGSSALSFLMAKLESLRRERGLSYDALAKQIGVDRADLHKLETGTRLCSKYVIGKLEGFYGTGDWLSILLLLAKTAGVNDKYAAYRRLEASAFSLHQYATTYLPGMLQTEAYARTLLRTAPDWSEQGVEEQVAERLGRQERLRGDQAVHYRAVLDEGCFARRPPADPGVWTEQLALLLEVARLWNVTLQVLPFSSGLHDISCGSLILVSQDDGSAAAYQESSHSAALITDAKAVAGLRLSYDALRDAALTPRESLAYIQRTMEEHTSCTPPDQT